MTLPAKTDGRAVIIDGQWHDVLGIAGDRPVMLLQAPDGRRLEMRQSDFHAHIAAGSVVSKQADPADPGGRIPAESERREQELRILCLRWLTELTCEGFGWDDRVSEIHARIAARPDFAGCRNRTPSKRTLQLWRKRGTDSGKAALLPKTHRSGNRIPRVSLLFEDIVLDLLDAGYGRCDRPTFKGHVAQAREKYRAACADQGVEPGPCGRDAVRAIVRSLPHDDLLKARLGREDGRRRTLAAVRLQRIEAPLDRVEIDCTIADTHLVDEDGHPIGRPTICAAIDAATGMILALRVSLAAPHEDLVVQAIRDLMMPIPEAFFDRQGIENRAQTMGRPKTIIVDQGSENSGPHLQAVIRNAELEFGKMIPGHPEKKPFVERLFREINRFCRTLPGASETDLRPAKERTKLALAEARLTLAEFDRLLQRWRFDVHARLPRRRIQSPLLSALAPVDLWQDCAARMYLPEPPGPEQLLRIFLISKGVRRLQRYGVELEGIQYSSPALRELLGRVGPGSSVEIRYDPTDIREIAVLDPDTHTHFAVPAKSTDLPAISFARSNDVRKRTRADPNTEDGVRAYMAQLAAEAGKSQPGLRKPGLRDRRRSATARARHRDVLERSQASPAVADASAASPSPRPAGRLRFEIPTELPGIDPIHPGA